MAQDNPRTSRATRVLYGSSGGNVNLRATRVLGVLMYKANQPPFVQNALPRPGSGLDKQGFVTFEVLDPDSGGLFQSINIVAVYPSGRQEAVFSLGSEYVDDYRGSAFEPIVDGYRFAVRPRIGWVDPGVTLRVSVVDQGGKSDTGVLL